MPDNHGPDCCRTCGSWRKPADGEDFGECWSGDRLDGDMSKGPAGYTFPWRVCEAWMPHNEKKPPTEAGSQ